MCGVHVWVCGVYVCVYVCGGYGYGVRACACVCSHVSVVVVCVCMIMSASQCELGGKEK